MDFDGVDIDNLSQDEILKLYGDTLEEDGNALIAGYTGSNGAYCYCSGYNQAYCSAAWTSYSYYMYNPYCK